MELIKTENELIFTTIVKSAKDHGLSLKGLCEKSDVNLNSLNNWKVRNPTSINTLMKIQGALKNNVSVIVKTSVRSFKVEVEITDINISGVDIKPLIEQINDVANEYLKNK